MLTFCNSIVMLLLSHAFVSFLFTFESTLDGEKTNRVGRDGHIFTLFFFSNSTRWIENKESRGSFVQ